MNNTEKNITWFRQATPYIKSHRGKTFVLWFPGEAIEDENFQSLIHDINLLHGLGIKLVIVHGSRPQIDLELEHHQQGNTFHQNLRISKNQDLDYICQASAKVRMKIEAMFSLGLADSPMQDSDLKLSSGNYVIAKPLGVIDGVDFEHTGEVRSVNKSAIQELLEKEHIVLLSNIAYSPTGETFNLDSEEVAKACATALKADKLIYFTESDGVSKVNGELIRELGPQSHAEELASSYRVLFENSLAALEHGVSRVHIVSYKINGALIQELFTREGSGTLVSSLPYETLRQASIQDVAGILELITPLEESGVLVKRSREILDNEIDQFTVLDRDGLIIGCAALYLYPENGMGELACICVDKQYQSEDRGDKLLAFIESQARFQKLKQLFVLTTQTAHWFQERGFQKASIDDLPMNKKALYNFQRNSLILIKTL